MMLSKEQVGLVLERHLTQTNSTVMELADAIGLPTDALAAMLNGEPMEDSAANLSKVYAYFSADPERWVVWPDDNFQRTQAFCRQRYDQSGTSMVCSASGLGLSTALLFFANLRPDCLYLDMRLPEDEVQLPDPPSLLHRLLGLPCPLDEGQEAVLEKRLVIVDHAHQLPHSVLQGLFSQEKIPLVLAGEQEKMLAAEKPENLRLERLDFQKLGRKQLRQIAQFYGIEHEDDIDWLKKNAPSYPQLQAKIKELSQIAGSDDPAWTSEEWCLGAMDLLGTADV